MSAIRVGYVPVGVKIAPGRLDDYPPVQEYHGISYCDAVRRASDGSGRAFLITPDSIEVCRWAPVVLGLREPDPKFNLKVEFNLPHPTPSVLVAPIDQYKPGHAPDTVLVRTSCEQMKNIVTGLGRENTAAEMSGKFDRSALSLFDSNGVRAHKIRFQVFNETLAYLNRSKFWYELIKWAFDRQWTTYILDLILDEYLANMSMCRNSTVIPYLTGKANVSYFCTGGIAWGRNSPKHMTCGMPFSLYEKLDWRWR